MANQYAQVTFLQGLMMADPETIPAHLGDQRAPRLIAYDAKNVIPTSAGYSSYFGTDIKLGTGVIPVQVQTILCYRTKAGDTILLALCADGAYMRSVKGDGVIGIVDAADITITLATGGLGSWTKVFAPVAESGNPWGLWTYTILDNKLYVYVKGMAFIAKLESTVANQVKVSKIVPTILNTASGKVNSATVRVQQEANNSTYKAITLNGQEFRITISPGLSAVEGTVARLIDTAGAHEDFTVKPIEGTRVYTETPLIAKFELPFLGEYNADLVAGFSHSGTIDELSFELTYSAAYFMLPMPNGIWQSYTGIAGSWTNIDYSPIVWPYFINNTLWTDANLWLFIAGVGSNAAIYYSNDKGATITQAAIAPWPLTADDLALDGHIVKADNGDLTVFGLLSMWRSTDNGANWLTIDYSYIEAGVDAIDLSATAFFYNGLYYSDKGYSTTGQAWYYIDLIDGVNGLDSNIVVFNGKAYRYRRLIDQVHSSDFTGNGSVSVFDVPNPTTDYGYGWIKVLNGMLYISDSIGGIWRSANGTSWAKVAEFRTDLILTDDPTKRKCLGMNYFAGHYVATWRVYDTVAAAWTAFSTHSYNGLDWDALETTVNTQEFGYLSNNWEF